MNRVAPAPTRPQVACPRCGGKGKELMDLFLSNLLRAVKRNGSAQVGTGYPAGEEILIATHFALEQLVKLGFLRREKTGRRNTYFPV